MFNNKNVLFKNNKDILTEFKSFYQDLCQNKDNNMKGRLEYKFSEVYWKFEYTKIVRWPTILVRGLSDKPRIIKALNNFKNNKSQGNNGLTAEFIKRFGRRWVTY